MKTRLQMKFEIDIDFIQTYKMIVDTPCETTAEMYGDNIDMEEFDKLREEVGRTGTGYVGLGLKEGTPNLLSKFLFSQVPRPSQVRITKTSFWGLDKFNFF